MKTFTVDIHPKLASVEIIVKNGKEFTDALIKGAYGVFTFIPSERDEDRVKKFAVKHGNDNSSNFGIWYAHCNGFAMDLVAKKKKRWLVYVFSEHIQTLW